MNDTLTGCLERRLEPPERKDTYQCDEAYKEQELEDEKYEYEFVRTDD